MELQRVTISWLIALAVLGLVPTRRKKSSTFFMYWTSVKSLFGVSGQAFYRSPYNMPGFYPRIYTQDGDIMVGVLTSISTSNGELGNCGNTISGEAWQNIERIAWPVSQINNNSELLPNVTLGFIAIDACDTTSSTMAASMAFLPRAPCDKYNFTSSPSFYYCPVNRNNESYNNQFPYHDVIGIVTTKFSKHSVALSYTHTVFQMPLMGHLSTSDELSNKANHPYYFRVVPPDKHQVEAMLTFISDHGWSYISVIYSQGPYGERAIEYIKEKVGLFGICIATHHRLTTSIDSQQIAANLVKHSRARVVIMFIDHIVAKQVFEEVKNLNYLNHFVWIGSDLWSFNYDNYLDGYKDSVVGAFSFYPYSKFVSPYYDYLGKQTPATSTNPFIKEAWESLTNCSFVNNTCDINQNLVLSKNYHFDFSDSLYFDAILAFAHAANDLIKEMCPHAMGGEARRCITGRLIAEYLKNVSFQGFTEYIEFDEFNDVKGLYTIRQLQYNYDENPYLRKMNKSLDLKLNGKMVGVYDMRSKIITYTSENISWSHLKTLDRLVLLSNGSTNDRRPESVCSEPCMEHDFKMFKEVSCCWECRRCRDNERLDVQNSICHDCPPFTWPDSKTGFITCATIPLTYPKVSH